MQNVIHRTDKSQSLTEASGTYHIYKTQRPSISIRLTHPKQQARIRFHQRHHDLTKTHQ
jgi:hypothetical protein